MADLNAAALRTTNWTVSAHVVLALLFREWLVFRQVWWSVAFGSVVEPLVYFVAFGYGYGAIVAELAGLSYLEFIATGTVAIGTLFSSIFPSFINGYVRRQVQHLYDGLLSAPVSVAEIVTAESLWNALRVSVVAVITTGIARLAGVGFGIGVLAVPALSLLTGYGFSCLGAALGTRMRSTHQFDFVVVGVIVPLFLCAGTFFPIDNLPEALATAARLNPLHHFLEVLRGTAFGVTNLQLVLRHLLALALFDALAWVAAVVLMHDALVD